MSFKLPSVKQINAYLAIFEKHPVVWFFVGIVMVLLADGTLTIDLSKYGLMLSAPQSFPVIMLIRFFGFSIALMVLYIYFTGKLPENNNRNYAAILGMMVWLIVAGVLIRQYIFVTTPARYPNSWDYDVASGEFHVELASDGLKKYSGDQVLLVVRRNDPDKNREDDTVIACSASKSIGTIVNDHMDLQVKLSSTFPDLKLGDPLECTALILPPHFDVEKSKCKCLHDFLKADAVEYFNAPITQDVSVSKLDLKYIRLIAKQLPVNDQHQLVTELENGQK